MAVPTVYASTDASAPVITGEHGSLVAALKAILVDGYGAKAGAGWSYPYTSGTDYACFRQAAGSHQRYFAVNDTDTRMARIIGYESMTDATSGSNPFPTSAQLSGGFYIRKSITEDAVARHWLCFATDRTMYLFIFSAQPASGPLNLASEGIGDVVHFAFGQGAGSLVPSDVYNTFAFGSTSTSATVISADDTRSMLHRSSITSDLAGHYLARRASLAAGSAPMVKAPASLYVGNSGVSGQTFPSGAGALRISKFHLFDADVAVAGPYHYRGSAPGLWAVFNASNANLAQLEQLGCSTPGLNGRTFTMVYGGNGGVAIETSAWDE
jgi:hypothetical protein